MAILLNLSQIGLTPEQASRWSPRDLCIRNASAASFWKASLLSFAPYNKATPDYEVRKQRCMISTHLDDV